MGNPTEQVPGSNLVVPRHQVTATMPPFNPGLNNNVHMSSMPHMPHMPPMMPMMPMPHNHYMPFNGGPPFEMFNLRLQQENQHLNSRIQMLEAELQRAKDDGIMSSMSQEDRHRIDDLKEKLRKMFSLLGSLLFTDVENIPSELTKMSSTQIQNLQKAARDSHMQLVAVNHEVELTELKLTYKHRESKVWKERCRLMMEHDEIAKERDELKNHIRELEHENQQLQTDLEEQIKKEALKPAKPEQANAETQTSSESSNENPDNNQELRQENEELMRIIERLKDQLLTFGNSWE